MKITQEKIVLSIANRLISRYGFRACRISRFDDYLSELLKQPSFFFIQIGAHDGVRFDNLYQKVTEVNVYGIVIEPIKKYFDRLEMNYEDYPFVKALNIALHPTDKEVVIHHVDNSKDTNNTLKPWSGGLGSLFVDHHNKTKIPDEYMVATKVKSMTFMGLIHQHKIKNVDLLQIDVEGFDYEILKMIDFSKIKPKLIKYEHVNLPTELQTNSKNLLIRNGYKIYIENNDTIGILENDS